MANAIFAPGVKFFTQMTVCDPMFDFLIDVEKSIHLRSMKIRIFIS